MSMMPCMTGLAGLRSMKRGMDSTREIVKHNILRQVSRTRISHPKKKSLKLHISTHTRNKAATLCKKINKRSFSWKYILITALLSTLIGILFSHFYFCFLAGITCLTVPYILFNSFMLAKREKPYINKKNAIFAIKTENKNQHPRLCNINTN